MLTHRRGFELRGIVHGWNDYSSGLQFTLIDETNGINAFSPVSDFGYDVEEGDSVRVRGVIDQYLSSPNPHGHPHLRRKWFRNRDP